MITVTKDNLPTQEYDILKNMIKLGDNYSCVVDFSANIDAGDCSTLTAGDYSTIIIYGDTAHIFMNGKNILLTMIYYDCQYIRKTIELDEFFKTHKKGDKITIYKVDLQK